MATLKVLLHGKEMSSLRLEPGQEYILGRAEGCAVQLVDQPGISRQHFRISDESGNWVASVISKFGEVIHGGQPVQLVELTHGAVFKLAGYDFRFSETNERSQVFAQPTNVDIPLAAGAEHAGQPTTAGVESDPVSPNRASATLSLVPAGPNGIAGTAATSPSPQNFAPAHFEGNEDATNVGVILPARPFIRIVRPDGSESRIELDGKKWLAGREDSCDIFLPDRKASRRQFEITSTPEGYFITDMGSSNGTSLNGDPLIPEDPRPIQSGDVISVNSLLLYFEIRDPNFEKRLVSIPQEIMVAPAMVPVPRFEIINYPVAAGSGGGAVRVDQAYDPDQGRKKKPNTLRLALILIIAVGGIYAIFGSETGGPAKAPSVNDKSDAMSRLTPQQRQLVKEIYVTARNLYMQGKFENAHDQLKKLHEVIPEGYEGSKAMEEDCLAQRAAAEQLAFVEQERKRVEEQRRMIDRNIRECNGLANSSMSVEQIRQCLAPTIGLDPTNPLVADLIGRVEKRVMERDQRMASQRDYADRVGRGRALYEKAEGLRAKSDWYAAIDAYNKHIASEFPDPNGLKAKSQSQIVLIRKMISDRVDEYLAAAEAAYRSKSYKEAIEAAKRAKEFDPKSEKAAEYIGRVRRELNSQLRSVYEDAILYEGVGRVQEAQTKWRQIIDRDTSDGEYFMKSKIKLKNYSDQSP
jgi:pSer/pThr/pTyr-binding forkhead associated (FHA) protein/tetratricopeptide (TPR) repeat protein